MIYANDEIFNKGCNADILKKRMIDKNKIKKNILENKTIIILGVIFIAFCSLNCALIYTFIDLLKNL